MLISSVGGIRRAPAFGQASESPHNNRPNSGTHIFLRPSIDVGMLSAWKDTRAGLPTRAHGSRMWEIMCRRSPRCDLTLSLQHSHGRS